MHILISSADDDPTKVSVAEVNVAEEARTRSLLWRTAVAAIPTEAACPGAPARPSPAGAGHESTLRMLHGGAGPVLC